MHTITESDREAIVDAANRCEYFLYAASRYRGLGRSEDEVRSLFMAEANASLGFYFAGDRSEFATQQALTL